LAFLCLDLGYKLAEETGSLTRAQVAFLIASWNSRQEATAVVRKMEEQGMSGWYFE